MKSNFPPIDRTRSTSNANTNSLFPPIEGEIEPTIEQRYAEAQKRNYQEDLAAQNRRYRMVAEREAARAAALRPPT
jgi:hypothetical protein